MKEDEKEEDERGYKYMQEYERGKKKMKEDDE